MTAWARAEEIPVALNAGPGVHRPSSTVASGRPVRRLVVLACLAALGIAALTSLGVWQLERRVQKLDLIDRVAQRSSAAPVAAPGPAGWPAITEAKDAYRRVSATGRFLTDGEVWVKAVTGLGPGFWVLTPFRTAEGFTVLVNRGFVPPEWRQRPRTDQPAAGEVTVSGRLRTTEPKGAFLRANDPGENRWYSRDVAAIGAALRLRDLAPYFIDADAAADPSLFPRGGLTVMSFPNNHLIYALTWFALALTLLAGVLMVVRDEWRIRKTSPF